MCIALRVLLSWKKMGLYIFYKLYIMNCVPCWRQSISDKSPPWDKVVNEKNILIATRAAIMFPDIYPGVNLHQTESRIAGKCVSFHWYSLFITTVFWYSWASAGTCTSQRACLDCVLNFRFNHYGPRRSEGPPRFQVCLGFVIFLVVVLFNFCSVPFIA